MLHFFVCNKIVFVSKNVNCGVECVPRHIMFQTQHYLYLADSSGSSILQQIYVILAYGKIELNAVKGAAAIGTVQHFFLLVACFRWGWSVRKIRKLIIVQRFFFLVQTPVPVSNLTYVFPHTYHFFPEMQTATTFFRILQMNIDPNLFCWIFQINHSIVKEKYCQGNEQTNTIFLKCQIIVSNLVDWLGILGET